jgi:hypothetical protein
MRLVRLDVRSMLPFIVYILDGISDMRRKIIVKDRCRIDVCAVSGT